MQRDIFFIDIFIVQFFFHLLILLLTIVIKNSVLGFSIDHFCFIQFAPKVLVDKRVRIICE